MTSTRKNHTRERPSDWQERRQRLLTRASPSKARGITYALVLKDETIFLVAQSDGLVPLDSAHAFGMYHRDCRYLNGYGLTLSGAPLELLGSTPLSGHEAIFELTNPEFTSSTGQKVPQQVIAVRLARAVDGRALALEDKISIHNFARELAVDVRLEFVFRADFDDVYVVRGMESSVHGEAKAPTWKNDKLILAYRGADDVERSTTISFSRPPDATDGASAQFNLHLDPGATATLEVEIVLGEKHDNGNLATPKPDIAGARKRIQQAAVAFRDERARIQTDDAQVDAVLERSFADLLMLRTPQDGEMYFAAGVPWFVTLFGRDSLISSLFVLPYHARSAERTLRLLAKHQGQRIDHWRDEEPGKILHEFRVGELANLGKIPHTPYYGTVDATPLFLILLARHAAWTGRIDVFRDLRANVDAALEWMSVYGEQASIPGYLSYHSEPGEMLVNQGWKDSGDGIVDENGHVVHPPIALVEVQGYAYAAKMEIATLYEREGEQTVAARLRSEAEELRRRFNRDFWIAEREFYGLALTSGAQLLKVDSSNPGHALFAGIVDTDKAAKTAQRFMTDDMFSGWGVRTLAKNEKAYNPVAYHRGTVWPHDNALLVAGLRRYGCNAEAERILRGMLDAATSFPLSRLPEVFSGFPRQGYEIPIRYPVACHPQAWAAASIPFMLAELLGLEVDGFERRLRIHRPTLPPRVHHLKLLKLAVGSSHVDLAFDRSGDEPPKVSILDKDGDLDITIT